MASTTNDEQKQQAIRDLETLQKIAQCKYAVSDLLKEESIFDIVAFLESTYYNRQSLQECCDRLLRFLFTPFYYEQDAEHQPQVPQAFWTTPLGKLIVSSLSANDDILVSAAEAGAILGYKRQNMRVLVGNDKLVAKKVGGNLVFKLLDVLSYKQEKEAANGRR